MSTGKSRRRWWIGGAILVLAVLYFVRPGADQLRASIVRELSNAIGRPVQAGSVSLHFLPQPGFDIENFSVADDPAFGSEPLLRSRHVSANLRLSTLWRRRLDISSLHLTEPSLNLVLNNGRWNTESILNRAANTPATPTAQTPTAEKPPFPYISASEGRINFKLGAEKKPWVLTEADFSVSLTSDDAWYLSLEGRPLRTDMSLSDTGSVRARVTLKRGPSVTDSPIAAELRWTDGQLGQVSRLITGTDHGWRGGTQLDLTLSGRASDLQAAATASLTGFHRYDVEASGAPSLSPRCSAHYSVVTGQLSDGTCTLDLGGSNVAVKASLTGLLAPTEYALSVKAEKIPASTVLALVKVAKQGVPRDLAADGSVDFSLEAARAAGEPPTSQFSSTAKGLVLRSAELKPELSLGDVALVGGESSSKAARKPRHAAADAAPVGAYSIGPLRIANPRGAPLEIAGWWDVAGYAVHVTGEAPLPRLQQLAHTAGLAIPETTADGSAHLDVTFKGAAVGFATPALSGTAQLKSVTAQLPGMSAPLEIETASVTLQPDSFRLEKLTAKLGPTTWTGTATRASTCAQPEACVLHLDLHTERLAAADLQELLVPASLKRPWYRKFSRSSTPTTDLAQLYAEGTLAVAQLEPAEHTGPRLAGFTAKFRVKDGAIVLLEGKLKAGTSIYALEGNIGGKGELDLQATATREKHHIVGTVLKPKLEGEDEAVPAAGKPAKPSR